MKLATVPLTALLAVLCACGGEGGARSAATSRPLPRLLILSRGEPMTLRAAVRQVRFAPFVPSGPILGVAAIPPLSDDEKKRAPGIAIEYRNGRGAMLLSQWPRAGIDITVGAFDATSRPCAPIAYKADGLLWATRNGRVMTLQPDGAVPASRVAHEANRLLRAGACERRARTLSRPPSRPVVSSPRQSAF